MSHPFFHDLRSRGDGIAWHDEVGAGNDYSGWEFHRFTKVAYGSVLINGTKYLYPGPTTMHWRPDGMIVDYEVAGVKIHEEKFIAENDVITTVITSSEDVVLQFDGNSYISKNTVTKTASCLMDYSNNSLHISEGGTVKTKVMPNVTVEGQLMYDGMSTVLSSNVKMHHY